MTGWTLQDSETPPNRYTFPTYTLAGGATVRVWVTTGVDSVSDLYWNLPFTVWNDSSDTASLRDEQGLLRSQCVYQNPPAQVVNCQ